ncbi:MAG TPA: HAD family phosphatase [Firmicutes bacterium]|nr:HAD family phosphatase [Bacillota bacterium]
MTARYRLLALDLDGTTLTPEGAISPETRHWISKATQAGVVVMCATGRGLPNAEEIWNELFPGSPAVLANGAEVWLSPRTLLERYFIDTEHVFRLYDLATDRGLRYWAYSANGLVKDGKLEEHEPGEGWFKFGIYHPDPEQVAEIWSSISHWEGITVTSSHPSLLEISAQGVSKKSGVERVCAELNISMAEVMAIGDNYNDLELIQGAGLGVAVDNATAEVKAAADRLTKSNGEDGVAHAIQQFLLS